MTFCTKDNFVFSLQTSESAFESQLVSKLCCFELMSLLYSTLEKSEVNSMESRINKSFCNDVKTGKELTMALTKYDR